MEGAKFSCKTIRTKQHNFKIPIQFAQPLRLKGFSVLVNNKAANKTPQKTLENFQLRRDIGT